MKPVDLAKSLAQALKESTEFRNFQEAKAKVEQHEAARLMVDDFRKKQMELYEKRARGADIAEDMEKIRKLSEILSLNSYARDVLMAEYAWEQLMMEVQKTIAEGLGMDLSKMGLEEEKP